MKEKILMLLTMFSIICLSSFTPSKEMNHTTTNAVKKSRPTVIVSYPSEFTRFINLQLEKAVERTNAKTKVLAPYITYFWWDFNGSMAQQSDPYYYSKDPDNSPECLTMTGLTYCEVRAEGNTYDDTIPQLSTINGTRYRQ